MNIEFNIILRLNKVAEKEQVYEFVKSIPPGKVATYGQIALYLGNRNFARVVGNILHGNPDPNLRELSIAAARACWRETSPALPMRM